MSQDANQGPPRPPPPPAPDPEDPKQIEQLIARLSKPFADLLDQIESLLLLQFKILLPVLNSYLANLEDVCSVPNDAPSLPDQSGVPALDAHRRVYHMLINMCRLFHPRLYHPLSYIHYGSPFAPELANLINRQDEWRPLVSPATDAIMQLLFSFANILGYAVARGHPLAAEYRQMRARVESGVEILEAPDQLWTDLQSLRTRFAAFLREFLNPELFDEAERQLVEPGPRDRSGQQAP